MNANPPGFIQSYRRRQRSKLLKKSHYAFGTGVTWHIPIDEVTYNQDGLISMHNVQSLHTGRFATAYAQAKKTGSWSGPWGQADVHWRAYIIYWAALQAAQLPGDFVECGVDHGGTAMIVIEGLGRKAFANRRFFLYDTFCGLDENLSSMEELLSTKDVYKDCYDEVKQRFEPYLFVEIVRGSVPQSFDLAAPSDVAYLHIDLNAEKPELAALEFFWHRLVPGAVLIFDDYAWISCVAQKRAIDAFLNPLGIEILTLPTGQGMALKPRLS